MVPDSVRGRWTADAVVLKPGVFSMWVELGSPLAHAHNFVGSTRVIHDVI